MGVSAEVYKVLWPIIGMVLSAAIGVILYFLKDIRTSIKEKADKQDLELEKLRDDLSKLKESLPSKYVPRDDFLRNFALLDKKMNDIAQEVGDLNKNVYKLIGGEKVD